MPAKKKTRAQSKPLVFLSHSSSDRRPLVELKRFLDDRAGGCLGFFLSSDDESIAPGTVWPTEVRNALDHMNLMLIFASDAALKSGWTYFEAGYGLCRTEAASVYCLPGQDRGKLPPPFNVLQNRNLHSARDLGLLIKHINDVLDVRLNETVSPKEFEKIFRRSAAIDVRSSIGIAEVVASIHAFAEMKPGSAEAFARTCNTHQLTCTIRGGWGDRWFRERDDDVWHTNWTNSFLGAECAHATGISVAIRKASIIPLLNEIKIDDNTRKKGYCFAPRFNGDSIGQIVDWSLIGEEWRAELKYNKLSLADLETHNEKIRADNERARERNALEQAGPFPAEIVVSPKAPSVSINAVNEWLAANKEKVPISIKIVFHPHIVRDEQLNRVTAKLHGSNLSITAEGLLTWHNEIVISWEKGLVDQPSSSDLLHTIVARVSGFDALSESQLNALVEELFETDVLSTTPNQRPRRK